MAAKFSEFLLSIIVFLEKYNGTVTALATVAIGFFTYFLVRVTNRQARLTKEVIDLTRAELVSNYRPRLRIRNIVVTPANPSLVQRMGIFQPNKPVKGQLYVVNVGGTAAKITKSHCTVFWNETGLPMRRPYEGDSGNNQIPIVRLEPGQSTPCDFVSGDPMGDRGGTIGNKVVLGIRLFIMGWVEYVDDRDIKRRTSFCREFEKRDGFGEGRFYAVDNQDYEHEE